MTQNNQQKLSLSTPDLIVLSLLSEQPLHGYDLNKELERREVKDWASISRPQVYYSLNKLKELKMIKPIRSNDEVLGPERQMYQISTQGKKELAHTLDHQKWAVHRPISSFLTWLALSTHTTSAVIARIIQARRTFLQYEIQKEKETLLSFEHETGAMLIPAQLMVDLTIQQFEVELKWLEKVEEQLLCF